MIGRADMLHFLRSSLTFPDTNLTNWKIPARDISLAGYGVVRQFADSTVFPA